MIKLPDEVRIYITTALLRIHDTVEIFFCDYKQTVSLRLKEKE